MASVNPTFAERGYERDGAGVLRCTKCGQGNIFRADRALKAHETSKRHKAAPPHMLTYIQTSGHFARNGVLIGTGYAGHEDGRNNHAMQKVHDVGPLPVGGYTIKPPVDTDTHGPYVLWLTPDEDNDMFGRSAFGIHGDSKEHPGLASLGCIVTSRAVREAIWKFGDVEGHRLTVVA